MTGIETAFMISSIFVASAMRATPPSARMSAGTRSRAMTATAPASSAMRAWSAVVTSMITPPLSISARPLLTRMVPISAIAADSSSARSSFEAGEDLVDLLLRRRHGPQEDGVLLLPHHVADVRLELLRREDAVGVLEAGGGVGVLGESDPHGIARVEGDQAAVDGIALDDPDLGRVGRDAVAVLTQAFPGGPGFVHGRLRVAARDQGRKDGEEEETEPHRAATVTRGEADSRVKCDGLYPD